MNTISCPNCHTPIDIDQVLAHQIEHQLQSKFQKDIEAAEKREKQLQAQIIETKKRTETQLQESLKLQEQKLKQELWQKAQEEARKKIEEVSQKNVKELQEQLKEQQERATKAEATELEMRKKQREIEEREKQFEINLERQLDKRLQEEKEKTSKLESEKFFLKEREYQKQIDDMKKLVEEAQRRASTVSQQLQGEVLELELERVLKETFPMDSIDEVKKGQFGADLIHTVHDGFGKNVGIIVWESKQTENFSEKWLPKLREDARASNGSVAVLVTRRLPDDIKTCGERDRVWITGIEFVLPLAQLLRNTLIKVAQEKTAQSGKDVKTEMIYHYINSQEFRGRVEAIVESFREMQDDLEREQRAMLNIWKKREKQILRLATNTAYMYGEMQGIVGASLPNIQGLELTTSSQKTLKSGKSDKTEEEIEDEIQNGLF
jgi:hypothetical protein